VNDGIVGIIANPAAGKDIRRLVSAASPVSDMAKIGIIRRAAIGAAEGGARRIIVADDRHALARRALDGLGLPIEVLDLALFSNSRDSQRAAACMADLGVEALIVLGGDGTHRDVAKGWRDPPMVAVSTGTNNVFPESHEATLAGHAAGLVATGTVGLGSCSAPAKVIDVDIEDLPAELGLVDLALTTSSFTGSRAVWDVRSLRELVAAIAEPASVGLSAVAAAFHPTSRLDPGGVHLRFASGEHEPCRRVRCPIAPGLYAAVDVGDHVRLAEGDVVEMRGPGALSFDGERDVVLAEGQTAQVQIRNDGPLVIDVARAMSLGLAEHGRED
jgi:hypothetical protein